MIRPVEKARILDLLVLAHAVESQRFHQQDVAQERIAIGRRLSAVRPVALVQHQTQRPAAVRSR